MHFIRFSAAMLAGVCACTTACTMISPVELRDMRRDIQDLRAEVTQLKQTMDENDRQLFYRLSAIQDKVPARSENIAAASAAPSPALPTAAVMPAPAPAAPVSNPEADQIFHQASQAWTDTKYDEAQKYFQEFIAKFPADSRAPEAQLQIGLADYNKADYANALRSFQEVIQRYPGSSSEPEAAAQMGYSYIGLNQMAEARTALEQVLERYPNYEQIEKVKEVLAGMTP